MITVKKEDEGKVLKILGIESLYEIVSPKHPVGDVKQKKFVKVRGGKQNQPWSEADIDLVVRFTQEGLFPREISKRLDRSPSSISSRINILKNEGRLPWGPNHEALAALASKTQQERKEVVTTLSK